ncbi:MAG: glycosyltransferase family 39 protein [Candidatus Wallbacteria bacterium]|nr:glycosyltransferase family 39 protein [Candidatus Wallbacteria bacterium]
MPDATLSPPNPHAAPPRLLPLQAVFLAQLAYFLALAWIRFLDADEGFYVPAAAYLAQGRRLYTDFFYPQMPLLPCLYGAWMWLLGIDWHVARAFSALLGAGIGTLLFRHCEQLFEDRRYAWGALAAYSVCGPCVGWFPIVKTYSIATFFLMACYCALPRGSDLRRYAWAGFFLGLAVDARLTFVVAGLGCLAHILTEESARRRVPAACAALTAGTVLGLLVCLPFLLPDPQRFWFNNLGYHAIRSEGGLIGSFTQKAAVLLHLAGIVSSEGAEAFQLCILLLFSLGHATAALTRRTPLATAFWFSAALALMGILPTPAMPQYFCVVFPFLIVTALHFVHSAEELLRPADCEAARTVFRRLALGLAIAYVAVSPVDFARYLSWGRDVGGIRDPAQVVDRKFGTVTRIARRIDEWTRPGEEVLSAWCGLLLTTHARQLPGMENPFGLLIADKLDEKDLDRYRLITRAGIDRCLATHRVRLVIAGKWTQHYDWTEALQKAGYRLRESYGNFNLWLLP